ncbi:hypothetical protein GCM10009722_29470 [Williamsia deligens]
MTPGVPGAPLALTAAQRGMWFAESAGGDRSVTVAHYVDIRDADGRFDRGVFARAVAASARDLESAHTRFTVVDDVPHQWIDPDGVFTVDEIDFRAEADPEAAAQAWMAADHARPMDLRVDPVAVSAFLILADDHTIWYLRGHHIAFDGYGALVCLHEAVGRYNAAMTGQVHTPARRATVAEVVADDARYGTSTRRDSDREYWAQRVVDLPDRITLPRGSAVVGGDAHRHVATGVRIDPAVQDALTRRATDLGASVPAVLTAAFAAFLARMTGTDDVVLSLPVTARTTALVKRSAGMVANMLPVRVAPTDGITGRDLVRATTLELTGCLRHQRFRFEDIRALAGLTDAGATSFGPIVNMVLFDKPLTLHGATVGYHILSSGVAEDLRLNVYQAGSQAPLEIDLHANAARHDADAIAEHLRRFLAFLERFVAAPDCAVGDLELLLPGERVTVAGFSAGPSAPTPDNRGLLGGFERQVAATPDAVAVVPADGTDPLTYADLDVARRGLAAVLAGLGVTRGDRVVVALPRGIDQVCAVYATVTLGAAYVPVDPTDPAERRAAIDARVRPRVTIDADFLARHGASAGRTGAVASTAEEVPADLPAYVLFTSGSTGEPKGVEVAHAAVVARLGWMQDMHPLGPGDAVLYKTPATFDVSVWELFWPLATGARMVLATPDGHRDPRYLRERMDEAGVTVAHFVPSMLDTHLDAVGSDAFGRDLRLLFCSGEALDAGLAARVCAVGGPTLVNLYGPTEATVDVTRHVVGGQENPVPIGRPVPGTTTHVLDTRLRPVPPGVVGELYLGGVQVAHGYVGAVDLTAERFVADPFGQVGARLYRTGDLVRWTRDGLLDYVGRDDDQVKIRGRRVELGEIGAVVAAMDGVDAAVVVVRHDLGPAPVLVAYVRGDSGSGTAVDTAAVRAWCRTRLPAHMVPAATVVLDAFPTTRSGKLDRRALPAPAAVADPAAHVDPRTPVERTVVRLVEDALTVPGGEPRRISVTDNLFRLGADSLVAARLVSRARDAGLGLTLTDVFDADDLRDLAARAVVLDAATSDVDHGRPERIPLAPAQTRLWFTHRMTPDDATYNMSGALGLRDIGDPDAWRAAVADVIDRHEILRTVFPAVDGEPVQQILPTAHAMSRLEASSPLVVPAGPAGRSDTIARIVGTGFDLLTDIPVRAALVTGDAAGDAAVIVVHHIAADGFSLRPLLADLVTAYDARRAGRAPSLPPLTHQYADVAVAQAEALGSPAAPSPRMVEGLAFWEADLRGAPQLLEVPTDRRRPRVASGAGSTVDLSLPSSLSAEVRALARSAGTTPFTVLHTALGVLLAHLAATDDVSIGTAVAGRDDPALSDMVGMFVTTVVLRSAVEPSATIADLVQRNHHVRAAAMAHADIPFERVVDALAPQRTPAHSPLFQVALTVGPDHLADLDAWSGAAGLLEARVPAAKYDLTWSVTDRPDAFDVEISYATDLFDEPRVAEMGAMFARVLAAMVADPTRTAGGIDVLSDAAVAALTAPRPSSTAPATLADLLAAGASVADPSSTAISGEVTMTWAELQATVARSGRDLIADGIGPGDVVAIVMPRSAQLVLAVATVAATGAAFVTVDPRFPASRVSGMIADSDARLVLATRGSAPRDVSAPVVLVDDVDVEWRSAANDPRPITPADRTRPIHVGDLAYLLYTSGSTGTPKAAGVTHAGLAALVAEQRRLLRVTASSRVLHVASPGFDVAVFEILLGLCAGAELVVSPADVFAGPDLEAVVVGRAVTHAVLTPSVAATVDPAAVPSISTMMVAGEACPPELVDRWSATGRGVVNLYGPTEATITSTATPPLREGDPITIGTPIDGVGAIVLGAGLRPVAQDVVGELYLSGAALGRGYHGRPDLTALRFVASPFVPGERLYRTGDLASRTADGTLVYHGRNDFQVKVRGMRVEPGEVDAVLVEDPTVSRAVTVGATAPSGETVLVSYVTGSDPSPRDLIERARTRLPAHLVPRTVTVLDEFPTTRTHKIDRSALPPAEIGSAATDHVVPRTQMETVVTAVVAEILGVHGAGTVSVHDDFFALGGSSLSAARLAARLERLLDRRIPAAVVFENPTPAALAVQLATAGPGRQDTLVRRPRPEVVGVSDRQRGLWTLNRADPTSAAYVIALTLELDGPVDSDALAAAIRDLVARHETLRTVYPLVGDRPVQVIVPAEQALEAIEITRSDVDAASVGAAVRGIAGRGFDLVSEPGVRAGILRATPERTVLVMAIHHMNADGASLAPLARDLTEAYAARAAGRTPRRPDGPGVPTEIDYADWTRWHGERLASAGPDGVTEEQRQLAYWGERLHGAPDRSELPTDRTRPDGPGEAAAVDVVIPPAVLNGLEGVARSHAATLFMVVHAAWAVLLARLSGTTDVVVGTPHAGRDDRRLDDVVGMFVTTVPLRTRISPHEPFTDLLARVRTEDLADLAHADVPFDRIVDHVLGRSPLTLHTPLFGVMLAFQDLDVPPLTLDGIRVTPRHADTRTAKVDLEIALFPGDLDGVDRAGGLGGRITYDTALFDRSTVETLVQRWVRLLEAVVADPATPVGDLTLMTPTEESASVTASGPDGADRSGRGALVGASAAAGLVSAAAAALPDVVAVEHDDVAVTFLDLEASAVAMATALPDTDAGTALVVALTSLLPTLGADEPDGVEAAIDGIARHAAALIDAVGLAGPAVTAADGAESA